MAIDIETLSYQELLELRHMIDRRLGHLDALGESGRQNGLKPGDTVSFAHPRQGHITGTLLRFNDRTATVVASSGQQWDVAPHLLRRTGRDTAGSGKKAAIIDIRTGSR